LIPVGEEALTEERVKRRLAAILAADVVAYSRLMGKTKPERSTGSESIGVS
jgi:class 3 adenylate cyclase